MEEYIEDLEFDYVDFKSERAEELEKVLTSEKPAKYLLQYFKKIYDHGLDFGYPGEIIICYHYADHENKELMDLIFTSIKYWKYAPIEYEDYQSIFKYLTGEQKENLKNHFTLITKPMKKCIISDEEYFSEQESENYLPTGKCLISDSDEENSSEQESEELELEF